MHRRLGFVLSVCGMAFAVMPLATVLPQPDFVMCVAGFAFFLIGIFFTIESVVKKNG